MADLNPLSWWRRFLALPNDSLAKIFTVSFLVAATSASAVAVTAVSLKPRQQANIEAARQERMQEMLASVPGLADILAEADADTLETRIVDLDSGAFADGIDPASFDMEAAATDPARSVALAEADDIAGIGRRANFAPVHILRQDGDLLLIVLPVHGTGYQSTIRAYLALEADLNTIAALSVYDQEETPGLGSRIAEAEWQDLWAGKRVADEDGQIRIEVVRGDAVGDH